jgi:manganese/zinc/iron transport system substrate-binding protein
MALVLLAAWAGLASARAAQLQVLATTTIVADLARTVGGDRVKVKSLMGPGVDPHLYKASARDVSDLARADVVFYSGLFLEGRMEDVLKQLARRGRRAYAVTSKIPGDQLLHPDGLNAHADPHVWGDPALWKSAADVVAEGLAAADPAGAEEYRERAEIHKREMDVLRAWAVERVKEIPEGRRVLVTSHDAFGYFGRAVGLEVVAAQGISTVTETSLASITKLADLVKSRGVRAVVVESSVSPAAMRRISGDAGVKIGGELFSDALGAVGDMREGGGERYDVGTYLGMFRHNVNTIVEALK